TWDGRWRVERELGRGTTGIVYLATDMVQNRPVAVKLLLPQWVDDPDAFARFEREARMMAGLDQHPNLVTLIAHGTRGRVPSLVMEHIEGETLRSRLDREKGPVEAQALLSWARQLAAALDFIHAHELV